MSKILVTGGAGFIGSHLCDRLVEAGHDVVILDDFSTGTYANIGAIRERVTVIEDSVLNIAVHHAALEGVEIIYHLAALISGYDSLHDPESYISCNILGLSRLLQMCRELERPKIVFASSSTVYGNQPFALQSEESRARPLTVYALSKYSAEHMLRMYEEFYGFDHVSLRLFNVYGPRQNTDHPYANVTCKFAYAAANGHSLHLYGDGEQSRDFVYIDDVVEAFLQAAGPTRHQLYNVGTGQSASINTLIREFQALSKSELKVICHAPWPNDIREIRADIARLEEEFGPRGCVPLREGLARTVAFFEAANRLDARGKAS